MDMGHYSAAPVVCPTITKMEHLKEVINRIKKNLPPRDGEYFYLLGNNHNHQSNLEVIDYIRKNRLPDAEDLIKRFSTLKCQPMLMPSSFVGGFDFDNIDNKVNVIRAVSY